ncbi:MAG: TM2 domain-containing protein [Clostridia bacterium]|jgi:hypothetical protein|nr:TM2 domain-containing protein [Clostridia bacterium]MCX4367194.1 TM2 domain-containing protein [Clostridia bacterium]
MSELEFDTVFDGEDAIRTEEDSKRKERSSRVDAFIMANNKHFPENSLSMVREKLMNISDDKFNTIMCTRFKDTTISLVLSILTGSYGIDRFYLGQVGLGVAKLLTLGGCGIWAIVDWFLIMGKTRDINLETLNAICG